jgi:hypothetical protein
VTGSGNGATLTTPSGKTYKLISNWWDSYNNETETYSGLNFTVGGSGNSGGSGNPAGFPSIFIGAYAGYGQTLDSNLPKAVSALTTIPTTYQYTASGYSAFNATYDVWFTANSSLVTGGNPGSGGAYLMVWMFKPTNNQPRGSIVNANVTIPGAGSGTWTAWYDNGVAVGLPPCVSYVSNQPLTGLSFDLAQFIANAKTNSWGVTNSQYLSIIFGGFEMWTVNGASLTKFCAQVN